MYADDPLRLIRTMASGSSSPNRRRSSATGTYGREHTKRRRLDVLGRLVADIGRV